MCGLLWYINAKEADKGRKADVLPDNTRKQNKNKKKLKEKQNHESVRGQQHDDKAGKGY